MRVLCSYLPEPASGGGVGIEAFLVQHIKPLPSRIGPEVKNESIGDKKFELNFIWCLFKCDVDQERTRRDEASLTSNCTFFSRNQMAIPLFWYKSYVAKVHAKCSLQNRLIVGSPCSENKPSAGVNKAFQFQNPVSPDGQRRLALE